MNTEMQLFSISRRKKPDYKHGMAHKVYENKLQQDFYAPEINQKWCTDFTYLFLTNGSKRYNCTIIDLHDRSVIASITDKKMTADLAKRTLKKAIQSQPGINPGKLLLHSDQGSQYTSKEFTDFCRELGITQSMSKAGYPYDNAPMERYFNTLKNELIYQSINIIIGQKKNSILQWKNLHMYIIIMYVRILTIIIKRLTRHVMVSNDSVTKIRLKCYKKV